VEQDASQAVELHLPYSKLEGPAPQTLYLSSSDSVIDALNALALFNVVVRGRRLTLSMPWTPVPRTSLPIVAFFDP
jgi:hypothetical protein